MLIPLFAYQQMTKVHLKSLMESLRSYDGNCNENFALKLDFVLSCFFCDYSMLITLYKKGELHFPKLGTNGFHARQRTKDLLQRACVFVRISNMTISRRRLPDYVKTLHQKACHTRSTIIFLHLTNQIIDL